MNQVAILKPLTIQLIGIVVTGLVLDQGEMLKCFLAGCLIFWFFFLYKEYMSTKIDRIDSFLLKYGVIVFFALIYMLVLALRT